MNGTEDNKEAETMNETKATYFNGDKAEYTGKTEILYGAIGYEAVLVEGHHKGETIWTYRAPKNT